MVDAQLQRRGGGLRRGVDAPRLGRTGPGARDGKFFLAGGTAYHYDNVKAGQLVDGSKLVYLWDPALWNQTTAWTPLPDLAQRRYYPSVTVGAESAVGGQGYFITGGLERWENYTDNPAMPSMPDTYEVYRRRSSCTIEA